MLLEIKCLIWQQDTLLLAYVTFLSIEALKTTKDFKNKKCHTGEGGQKSVKKVLRIIWLALMEIVRVSLPISKDNPSDCMCISWLSIELLLRKNTFD